MLNNSIYLSIYYTFVLVKDIQIIMQNHIANQSITILLSFPFYINNILIIADRYTARVITTDDQFSAHMRVFLFENI